MPESCTDCPITTVAGNAVTVAAFATVKVADAPTAPPAEIAIV